jgi:hypothetical protein
MNETFTNSLAAWNAVGQYLAIGLALIGAGFVLYHQIRLLSLGDKKAKYDYINLHEINTYWYAALLLIAAGTVWVNTFQMEPEPLWVFARVFVSTMSALILGVVIQNLLKFYYPFSIERRLKRLRYSPRINPNNGKRMKLLSEEEEDVHLDAGMIAEESIFSVDYDVWIDETTGYKKIEKYNGHLHALKCPECQYQTFKVKKEEVLLAPTQTTEGELLKHYHCAYCGHRARKSFRVAPLENNVQQAIPNKPTMAGA